MREQLYQFYLTLIRITGLVYFINHLRVATALSRGALVAPLRTIKDSNPVSWEFSAFSQNGEDGIIDQLTRKLIKSNHYFIEIGAYDGIECNTAYLAIARKYNGLMVEGNKYRAQIAKRMMASFNIGCTCAQLFVSKETIPILKKMACYTDPDVLSLDIDGVDYYIAKKILTTGFRPKIFVVEYNSVYGPDNKVTIPYKPDFDYNQESSTQLYFGCSIAAWKDLFTAHGYQFVTVDSRGANAFFIHPDYFDKVFVKNLRGLNFQENFNHMRKYAVPWKEQFNKIRGLAFKKIK